MINNKKFYAGIFLLLLSISLVNAFGVAGNYIVEYVMPGESGQINLVLQNTDSDKDTNVHIEIDDGYDYGIATLPQQDYFIKAREKIAATIDIKVPEGTPLETIYTLRVTVTTGAQGGGALAFGTGIVVTPSVFVGEKPAEAIMVLPPAPQLADYSPKTVNWLFIIVTLLIIVIIILVIKRKRS